MYGRLIRQTWDIIIANTIAITLIILLLSINEMHLQFVYDTGLRTNNVQLQFSALLLAILYHYK